VSCIDVSEKNIATSFVVKKTREWQFHSEDVGSVVASWFDDQGTVKFSAGNKRYFSALEGFAPVQTGPWAHPTLLYNGYSGQFLLGQHRRTVKATSLLHPRLKLINLELHAQTTFPYKHSWSAQGRLCIYPTCWFVSPKSNQGDDFRPWRRSVGRWTSVARMVAIATRSTGSVLLPCLRWVTMTKIWYLKVRGIYVSARFHTGWSCGFWRCAVW
jgi:hypothetical protein